MREDEIGATHDIAELRANIEARHVSEGVLLGELRARTKLIPCLSEGMLIRKLRAGIKLIITLLKSKRAS